MGKEIPSLPVAPPDTLSAFLDDVQVRWSREDQKRVIALMIDIIEGIHNTRYASSEHARGMHTRNTPAFFVELITLSARYFASNPASLTADFLKLLNLRLEIHPKSVEQFESIEGGPPPVISLLDTLRSKEKTLATLPSLPPKVPTTASLQARACILLRRLLGGGQ